MIGPYPLSEVLIAVKRGQVRADTLLWREGLPDFMPAGTLPEVAPHFRPRWSSRTRLIAAAIVILIIAGVALAYWANAERTAERRYARALTQMESQPAATLQLLDDAVELHPT